MTVPSGSRLEDPRTRHAGYPSVRSVPYTPSPLWARRCGWRGSDRRGKPRRSHETAGAVEGNRRRTPNEEGLEFVGRHPHVVFVRAERLPQCVANADGRRDTGTNREVTSECFPFRLLEDTDALTKATNLLRGATLFDAVE